MYISASNYENTGIISTEAEMTEFIHDNDIISIVTEHVNDADYAWDLNTPELFSAACTKYFSKKLPKMIQERGYAVKGNALDLVSDAIWDELYDIATSGDFDIDDDIAEPNDIDPEEWVESTFPDTPRQAYRTISPEDMRRRDEELQALDARYSPRDRGNADYTAEYNAIMRKYRH